jgi:hypothetical protein
MVVDTLTSHVLGKINEASELYHRLILIVAPSGGGKTKALQELQAHLNSTIINVNLELSRRMLELSARQRPLKVPRLLGELVYQIDNEVVLLDNFEILFEISLKQDPLRLLQGLSRNKTVVAAWNGEILNGKLTYAAPDHPEYRRYPVRDFLVVIPAGKS